jgi:hypothetical protein
MFLLVVGASSWLGLTFVLLGRAPWQVLPARWRHARIGDVQWVLPSPDGRCRQAERCLLPEVPRLQCRRAQARHADVPA